MRDRTIEQKRPNQLLHTIRRPRCGLDALNFGRRIRCQRPSPVGELFVKQRTTVTRITTILILALALTGCGKAHNKATAVPTDPISRFVGGYSNIQGSIIWSSVGTPTKISAEEALARLRTNGVKMPTITNLSLVEMRVIRPEEPHLARRLTNCVAALVDTEIGQKIILLREFPGEREWCYHVFDSK